MDVGSGGETAVKEDTRASGLGHLTDAVTVPEEEILGGETGFGGREFIFILNTLELETPMGTTRWSCLVGQGGSFQQELRRNVQDVNAVWGVIGRGHY